MAWGARNSISTLALTKKNKLMKYAWFHVTNVFTQSRKARGPPPPFTMRYQLPSPQAPKAHAQWWRTTRAVRKTFTWSRKGRRAAATGAATGALRRSSALGDRSGRSYGVSSDALRGYIH